MNIELYSKANCPFCDKAKLLLEMRNMEYTEIKLEVDISRSELLDKIPTARTMPQVVINEAVIGGYDDLAKYLDSHA